MRTLFTILVIIYIIFYLKNYNRKYLNIYNAQYVIYKIIFSVIYFFRVITKKKHTCNQIYFVISHQFDYESSIKLLL